MSSTHVDDHRTTGPDGPGRPGGAGGGDARGIGHAPDAPAGAAALAGLVSVAASLGLAELVAGLTASVPSLVTSVGQVFIPLVPAWLKDVAIGLFGWNSSSIL